MTSLSSGTPASVADTAPIPSTKKLWHCGRCGSHRMARVVAYAKDAHYLRVPHLDFTQEEGYLMGCLGIGHSDGPDIMYCLECGQLDGEFPVPEAPLVAAVAEHKEWEQS